MSQPASLDEANCWAISGIGDAEKFFRAIPFLVPEATLMFLEGAPDPDIVALLSLHEAKGKYGAPVGTLWSWPRSNRRFSLRASSVLFSALADAATRHAQPEICCHVHLYRDSEPLVQWFDAFTDPLLVSKAIPRERVERFCSSVGGVMAEPAT